MGIPEDVEAFIREYEALCRKYNMYVGACGCCNSPWIVRAWDQKEIEDHIEHLREEASKEYSKINNDDGESGLGKIFEELAKALKEGD